MGEAYDSESKPDGIIMLCVAENKLQLADVRARLDAVELPDDAYCYGDFGGIAPLREAFADYLSRTVVTRTVSAEDVRITAGLSGVLDVLFWLLADAGQSVLVPAPYYPMFEIDCGAKPELTVRPIAGEGSSYLLTAAAIREAIAAAEEAGQPAAAILLCNPLNPVGRCYSRDELMAAVDVAAEAGLHLVSDEVYSNMVYDEEAAGAFISVADIVGEGEERMPPHVHVLNGMSKQVGMSGLRIGLLWSHNKPLLEAYGMTCGPSSSSIVGQFRAAQLLADVEWMQHYSRRNLLSLRAARDRTVAMLEAVGAPYVMPGAAVYVWADLREWMDGEDVAAEQALLEAMVKESRVFCSPGSSFAGQPGFFRICFASLPLDVLDIGCSKLQAWLLARREAAAAAAEE
eukprot:PLAT5986.1.p1 GENE.PLAT5986.1~~PLAT5986.1.p1  ORF type:complete len:430 (-),score=204.02 PLAT5986.1:33-1238(-)